MATWLYAVVPEPSGARGGADALPAGVGPGHPRLVQHGDVAAVVSDAPVGAVAGLAPLLAHERVVEAVAELAGAVLPARFGTRLPDDDAVRHLLAEHDVALRAALARVRGRAELAVRVALPPADVPADGGTDGLTGRQWLDRRLAARAEQRRLRTLVHDALAALADDAVWRASERAERPAAGAYLVDRQAVPAFRARVDALVHEHGLALTCTGPWPPYSFCSLEEEVA